MGLISGMIESIGYEAVDAAFESVFEFAMEATEHTLTKEQREALPDSAFGIPSQRKFPLIVKGDPELTYKSVSQAYKMFHYAKPEYKRELAANIVKAIKSQHLDIKINPKSMICKYTNVPSNLLKEEKESA